MSSLKEIKKKLGAQQTFKQQFPEFRSMKFNEKKL